MTEGQHFSIEFDGPALAGRQMDVREFAPSLIGLSELLELAGRIASADAPGIRVDVRAGASGDTFKVDLVAVPTLDEQTRAMFSVPPEAPDLAALLGALGLVDAPRHGVVGLINWLRGRRPRDLRPASGATTVDRRIGDHQDSVVIDDLTGILYQSRAIRQALVRMIRPLSRDGIDSMSCGAEGEGRVRILKSDVAHFERAAAEPEAASDVLIHSTLLQLEGAVFEEAYKWRFHDGATTFHAEIADPDFLRRVDSGAARFGKGDVLVVDLRRVQTVVNGVLKVENVVELVREHRLPVQVPLLIKEASMSRRWKKLA